MTMSNSYANHAQAIAVKKFFFLAALPWALLLVHCGDGIVPPTPKCTGGDLVEGICYCPGDQVLVDDTCTDPKETCIEGEECPLEYYLGVCVDGECVDPERCSLNKLRVLATYMLVLAIQSQTTGKHSHRKYNNYPSP